MDDTKKKLFDYFKMNNIKKNRNRVKRTVKIFELEKEDYTFTIMLNKMLKSFEFYIAITYGDDIVSGLQYLESTEEECISLFNYFSFELNNKNALDFMILCRSKHLKTIL